MKLNNSCKICENFLFILEGFFVKTKSIQNNFQKEGLIKEEKKHILILEDNSIIYKRYNLFEFEELCWKCEKKISNKVPILSLKERIKKYLS